MRCRLSILFLYCLLFVVMFAPACAKRIPSVDSSLNQIELPFLVDGKTTRKEVLLALGISTARFEGERILSYMLLFEEEKGFAVLSRYSVFVMRLDRLNSYIVEMPLNSRGGCGLRNRLLEKRNAPFYHLILVFDKQGVLSKHNFVLKSGPSEIVWANEMNKSGKLSFLQDGKTTKEQVLLKLGIPSGQFEGERIITYRFKLGGNDDIESGWYSFVLVFDDEQILKKHSMVKMIGDR